MADTSERKTIRLGDVFTEEQIKKAAEIAFHYQHGTGKSLCDLLVERVVRDAMPRINEVTGQENDERYFGYMLEYALTNEHTVPKP